MSPEALTGTIKQVTGSVDVWAMGVMLFMMVEGRFPFTGSNNHEFSQNAIKGNFHFNNKALSSEVKDLITLCFETDQNKRITST